MVDFKKIVFVLLLGLAPVFSPAARAAEPPLVRVALARDAADISLAVDASFDVLSFPGRDKLWHASLLKTVKVSATEDGIRIGPKVLKAKALVVTSKKKASIFVNRKPYRGDILILKNPSGSLLIINCLDLESYVKGVLAQEISPRWPIDAIKAQAVAARTYALYQRDCSKTKLFDLAGDTSSQVYGGFGAERNKSNRAVNFTYGEILLYKGKAFPAYFHATCGGMTEPASELWAIDIEPLSGNRVCSYCEESPHYYWEMTMDLKAIRKKMGTVYALKGNLANIRVTERSLSGRVRGLELKDDRGQTQLMTAKDFRQLLGADTMRSTNFTMNLEGERVTFSGKGWGHGVGLCQWGALGMSKKGYDYLAILKFYYPGSEIKKIY